MIALALLKKWRWHQIGKEVMKIFFALLGLVFFFVVIVGLCFGHSLRYNYSYDIKILLLGYLGLLAFWSIFYFLVKRVYYLDSTDPEKYDNRSSYYLCGGWYHPRLISVEIAICALGPYCLEVCFGGMKNIGKLLFVRLNHLGEVVDFLLRNPRRVTLEEIEAEELPVFEKYLAPLIGMEVCQLLTGKPIGVCVCTPFKQFCLRKLGLISEEESAN